jgi:solute:Na+ symporter, SSS family
LREMNREMVWSRIMTLGWGIILTGGAMLFITTSHTVIEIGLQITSLTYGGLLGVFFLGLVSQRSSQMDATIGFIAGLLSMVAVVWCTTIGYTWHTFIGCSATVIVGTLSRYLRCRLTGRTQALRDGIAE